MRLRRILVPLDGSDLAERALPIAEQVARHAGAELILARAPLARAFTGMDAITATEAETRALAEAHDYLQQVGDRLEAHGARCRLSIVSSRKDELDPVIGQVVRPTFPFRQLADLSRDAAEAIAGEAASWDVDLIVMATHGRSGLGRWVYGSVAMEVLQRATMPVLLVRPTAQDVLPVGDDLRILVPLDGTALGETALAPAEELARRLGGSLVLVRAIPTLQRSGLGLLLGPLVVDPAEHAALEAAAQSYLESIRDALAEQGLRADILVVEGDTPVAVARVARERSCALVSLATHGRAGLTRLAIGSRAEAIIGSVSSPVLVVHPVDVEEGERVLPAAAEPGAEPPAGLAGLMLEGAQSPPSAAESPAVEPTITLELSARECDLVRTALLSLLQTERRDAHLGEPLQRLLARLDDALAADGDAVTSPS